MKYYKLKHDNTIENEIIAHCFEDFKIPQNELISGIPYKKWNNNNKFCFKESEGKIAVDLLANDKGWLVVSDKLKKILDSVNTEIQFFPIDLVNTDKDQKYNYYIANILRVVDALCLEQSEYFETYIDGIGMVYTISKFAIYNDKTKGSDVFKLSRNQEIPVFVSEKFKELIEKQKITGISFNEIRTI